MRRRNWSIRSRIMLLVLPPIVMFVPFWLIGTTASGVASLNLLNSEDARAGVLEPGAAVVTELQRERQLTAAKSAALRDQRARTDAAVATYRRKATAVDSLSDRAAARVAESRSAFDTLANVRTAADVAGYDRIIDAVFRVYQPLTELDDPEATRLLRASVFIAGAREQLARQETLRTLGRADTPDFHRASGAARQLLAEASAELDGARRARLAAATDDRALLAVQTELEEALADRTDTVTTLWYLRFGLTALVGLLFVIAIVAFTVRVGRSLIRRLQGLRDAALDHAVVRLPDVVRRLRQGETVDLAAEAAELEFGTDEIGEVARAFSAAQRTAVESAIQEARVRHGLNEVFLNIARRSQTLLHRQLLVLDTMERRTTDPQELEDLFRIDHMATRMRRHAEDLVILAGAAPGRGWREPVPLVDVVCGAVSEVEDYTRVDVLTIPEASLTGRAVTELIHLLAELIENATSFSPPHTRVTVVGQLVPNGFAVEVEDRGLGMSEAEVAEANARLRRPPDFDPASSARLGLFVVALLAARLGAQVTLRSSPFGGVTAVVLVPPDLVVAEPSSVRERAPVAAKAVVVEAVAALPAASAVTKDLGRAPEPPGTSTLRKPPKAEPPPESPPEPLADPAELTEDGLPRRTRKSAPPPSATDSEEPLSLRPPEQTRAMMSAFQSAFARGRRDAEAAAELDQEKT